jgi:hypothetical protein
MTARAPTAGTPALVITIGLILTGCATENELERALNGNPEEKTRVIAHQLVQQLTPEQFDRMAALDWETLTEDDFANDPDVRIALRIAATVLDAPSLDGLAGSETASITQAVDTCPGSSGCGNRKTSLRSVLNTIVSTLREERRTTAATTLACASVVAAGVGAPLCLAGAFVLAAKAVGTIQGETYSLAIDGTVACAENGWTDAPCSDGLEPRPSGGSCDPQFANCGSYCCSSGSCCSTGCCIEEPDPCAAFPACTCPATHGVPCHAECAMATMCDGSANVNYPCP